MPDPLFSDEEQRPADTSLPSSFTIGEIHPSPLIFRFLHRLRLFWFEILPRKFRLIFTCIALGFFNLTNRLACFFQRRNSSSMNDPLISSQEDFNHSLDRNSIWTRSNISQPSLPSDKMAHMLVQQQRQPAILRSPSITIHRPSNKNSQENSLPAVHSVDERLFLCKHDSTRLIHLLTRFASEPQMPVCHIQSANIFDFQLTKSASINNTTSKPALQFDLDEINFDEIFQFNCDKPSTNDSSPAPVPAAPEEPAEPMSEPPSTSSENPINGSVEDDTLVDVSPNGPSDINDVHGERHFRRRKRRSSLTKTSISSDDSAVAPLIDSTENIQLSSTSSDTVELNPPPPSSSAPTEPTPIPSATVVDEQEIQENEEKSAPLSRYRGRRLRHRFYRQANATMAVSSSSECSPVQFHLSDEPMTRLPSPPARDSPSTPEPVSVRMPTTPPALNGALKRTASAVSRKKSVYFADSVGKSLTEVQYIRSNKTDSNPSSSKELSFLMSSSLFSSSPPSYSKSDLYLPSSSLFEHKPWSFDVALSAKQYPPEKPLTRRFFCLYRQPNSEHPDIYLHEVWKRQVKLEHAEIPAHHSSTGEQYLIGTVWVTNAAFSKYVAVKYTFNRWLNSYESEAQYRRHSNDFRNLDLFEFHIDIPIDVDRVDFVLRYCVNGQQFWDNNDGQNYTLQTESAAIPSNTISLPHDCDFNEMRFY